MFAAPCLAQLRVDKMTGTPHPSLADGRPGDGADLAERGEEMTDSQVFARAAAERNGIVGGDGGKSHRPLAEKDVGDALDAGAAGGC